MFVVISTDLDRSDLVNLLIEDYQWILFDIDGEKWLIIVYRCCFLSDTRVEAVEKESGRRHKHSLMMIE